MVNIPIDLYVCGVHNDDLALSSMRLENRKYSKWEPSRELLEKCRGDLFPWKEKPKSNEEAQEIIDKFKLGKSYTLD